MLQAILILAGVGLLWANRAAIIAGWRSSRWQPVSAKVLSSALYTDPVLRCSDAFLTTSTQRIYTLEYHVGEKVFVWTAGLGDRAPYDLQQGSRITIFYDPACPERAVFKRGVPLTALAGVVIAGLGVFLLL